MAWDDIQTADSCFTPADWNAMVAFVKGLSCLEKSEVTFYMYSDCSNETGQKFKFDFSGDDSLLYGGDASGDDLFIYSNSSNAYPFLALFGDSDVSLCVSDEAIIRFYEGGRQFFRFDSGANLSLFSGGNVAGDDLYIYPNTIDSCPAIKMLGDSDMTLEIPFDADFYISTCSNEELLKVSNSGIWYKGDAINIGEDSCPTLGDLPFTLYDDCDAKTGIGFQFKLAGTLSTLEGGSDSGDDLIIKANSNDTYPFIKLFGDAELYLEVDNEEEILFLEGGDQFFLFDRSGTSSLLYGGADTGDSLKILANTTDTYPFMTFEGDDYIEIRTTNDIYFFEQAAQMFKFSLSGAISSILGGASTGDAFKILANDTDTYPFIQLEGDDYIELKTTNDIYFYEQAEQMFKFLLSGTLSILYGGANTGDDLFIGANDNDICSMLKLWGDSGASLLIKAGSIFDVSTCSDESLFEVNSSAGDKHVDFHCLDARNFVLELRTTDPSAPTCLGQIWFRSDLV